MVLARAQTDHDAICKEGDDDCAEPRRCRWTPPPCKWGTSCWRPACPYAHGGGAREAALRELAGYWADQVAMSQRACRQEASRQHGAIIERIGACGPK